MPVDDVENLLMAKLGIPRFCEDKHPWKCSDHLEDRVYRYFVRRKPQLKCEKKKSDTQADCGERSGFWGFGSKKAANLKIGGYKQCRCR